MNKTSARSIQPFLRSTQNQPSPFLGCPAIVFGEKDLFLKESKRLEVSLRIDVRPLRREVVPKVIGFTGRVRGRGSQLRAG
jgi:hypothetical protein